MKVTQRRTLSFIRFLTSKNKELQMNKSVKSLLATSIVAATLIGETAMTAAAEPQTPSPQMMQGQRDGQNYGPCMMGY